MKTAAEELIDKIYKLIQDLMISVGQFGVRDNSTEIIDVTVEHFAEYVRAKHKHYTFQEIEKALKYGRDNDQTQGGHIYAQRLILWLKKYHTEVWLKQNQQAIHNGTFNQPEKTQRLGTSKNVSDEFIADQKRKYQSGDLTVMLTPVYETLERKGEFNHLDNDYKWEVVYKAKESLLAPFKDITAQDKLTYNYYKMLKAECDKVELFNSKSVSPRIKAECQRLMVIDWFEKN